MVTDGEPNFGTEYTVVYIEVEIQCCKHETYMML